MTIPVTRAFLPPLSELQPLLEEVWASGQLANDGPMVRRLEEALKKRLGFEHVVCVGNGTLALQVGLQASFVKAGDEVVTPAFSYVATPSAVATMGAVPVLVDIDPSSLCVAPERLREAITDRTTALLPVHVYGNLCAMEEIHAIAEEAGLPIVHDAAHAIDARVEKVYKRNAWCYSFHATKMFHTGEGGCVATDDPDLADRARAIRNFGHGKPYRFRSLGMNAKMSEVQAALGLAVLPHLPKIIEARGAAAAEYHRSFLGSPISRVQDHGNVAYFPILLRDEAQLLRVMQHLEVNDVSSRRYFYPCLTKLPFIREYWECPVAEDVARRVLCLPLSHDLTPAQASTIAHLVKAVL